MRGGSGGKRAVVVAAVLLAVVAVLLWRPLLRFRTHTLGPFLMMAQHTTVTWQPDSEPPTNALLTDPATEMHPWALFAARELRAGRLPLWNSYNAAGAPLFANYQSALLSPFTLPYYVLPLKAAVLASALLKLLVAATFAYLFLRSLHCTVGAALLGGAALAASGTCLVLLQHPHAGVFALLPACLYCAEVLCQRCEAPARSPRALAGAAAWLALAIGVSALAGHPETLLFDYVVLAAYAAYRWATLAAAPARRRAAAGWLLAAAFTGLALGAVQMLPFAEYIGRSSVFVYDRVRALTMRAQHLPMQIFPFLAGMPSDPEAALNADMGSLYQDVASFFVGGVVLLCASIGLLRARSDGRARFFAALALLWIVFAHDFFGLCTWLYTHTSLAHIPVTRTHPLWAPSACFLAALGVSSLERNAASAGWRRGLLCLALAAGLLALFHWGARAYLDGLASRLGASRAELQASADRHLATMGALFALGAEGLVLIASSRRTALRVAGHAALIASVVAGSALTLADYVPTVNDRYVFPRTEVTEALQEGLAGERVVFLTTGTLSAELNLVYGVRTIESYDAVGVRDSMRLIVHFFGGESEALASDPRRASKRGLELFGVAYVATRGDWVPVGTELADLLVTGECISAYNAWEWKNQKLAPWPHPRRNKPLRIELQASRDGLDGVAVQFIEDEAALTSTITLRVIDVEEDRELARVERRMGLLPVLSMIAQGGRCELVARFDPLPQSKGRKLALEISTTGEPEDPRPRVLRSPWPRPEKPQRSIPMIDLGYGQSEFERVCREGNHSLFRYTRSPGRAWIVGEALAAATHEEAFERVVGPDFEPLEQVVLERAEGAAHGGPFELETLSEEPCRWRFQATCATPGWLVVAQAFYPGWKARIDGQERPVLRANYGLTAVELPAGEHQIELVYDPPSVRLGAALSLLAALCIAAGVAFGLRGGTRDTGTP